jgi:cell division protein FtsB
MPSPPRRTPGSQSPAARPTTRRPASGRGAVRRPVAQRRTAVTSDSRTPIRRRRKPSGTRIGVLGLVLSAIVLTVAFPAERYLSQRSQIAKLESDQAAEQARIASLEDRRAKWNDPAYVRAQARERLQYVRPGEIAYVVVHDQGAHSSTGLGGPAVGKAAGTGTWYDKLVSSVHAADHPAVAPR